MKKTYGFLIAAIAFLALTINSCSSSNDYVPVPVQVSPVEMDLTQVPYPVLSDYKFFGGDMKNQSPAYGLIPFEPISGLFTDYALKKRFVWMPAGTKATYDGDGNVLVLPVGGALVKTFYYNRVQPSNTTKIIETRVMIRKSTGWIFADYVWNDAQTEAVLQTGSSVQNISWIDETSVLKNVDYEIPAEADCLICHRNNGVVRPIGIKPQNLNSNYVYGDGTKNQLAKWIAVGYLENTLPSSIVTVVDYKDVTKSLELRARSYVDINCAHCHQDGGEAEIYAMRFEFNKTNQLANMGVCQTASHVMPGFSGNRLIAPGDIAHSMIYARMNTNDSYYRMPMRGRTTVHTEGLLLMEQWINTITDCP